MIVIALYIGSYSQTHLEFVSGLRRYAEKHRLNWDIHFDVKNKEIPPDALVIGAHSEQVQWAAERGHKYIGTLFGPQTSFSRPCIAIDQFAFGHTAAKYFKERRYQRVCILQSAGVDDIQINAERMQGFREACDQFHLSRVTYSLQRIDQEDDLEHWLQQQDEPIGVYACTDGQASWLRRILLSGDGPYPRHVALLGTGNHLGPCLSRKPTLSSVTYPWFAMGQSAAHWAHRILNGGVDVQPQLCKPHVVVDRDTTPLVDIHDPMIKRALRWIEHNPSASKPLQQLASLLGCAPQTLCRRFKRTLGDTPQKLHAQRRMNLAQELLRQGRSVQDVADAVGYASIAVFSRIFKKHHDCTPSEWKSSRGL